MIEFINSIFIGFAWDTGILGSIKEYKDYWIFVLILMGILACFFGFKTYRVFFSLFTFMVLAIVSSYFMKSLTDWGTIVTTFAVVGSIMAFLAYRWTYLGALVINVLITLGLVSMASKSIVVTIAMASLVAIVTFYFPVLSVSIFTSIFGAIIIREALKLNYIAVILLFVCGSIIQSLINRNQSIFEKEYPDKLKEFLEKKKKRRIGC